MESVQRLKCRRGDIAVRVCAGSCLDQPLICNDFSCICQNSHIMCLTMTILGLNMKIQQRGKCFQPLLLSLASWYERQIKCFTTELENIRNIIGDQKLHLDQELKSIHQIIKEGKSSDLTSLLIQKTINSFKKQPEFNVKKLIKQVQQQLEEKHLKILDILNSIQKFSKNDYYEILKTTKKDIVIVQNQKINTQKLCLYFSQSLLNPNLELINKNIVKAKTNSGWKIALTDQPVSTFGNKKQVYKFRVIQTLRHDIMFGFFGQPTNQSKSILTFRLGEDNYIINGNNGMIYTNEYQPYRDGDNFYQAQNGNIISISFDPPNKKIVFKNQTRNPNKSVTVYKITQSDITACVLLLNQHDSIAYEGMQLC